MVAQRLCLPLPSPPWASTPHAFGVLTLYIRTPFLQASSQERFERFATSAEFRRALGSFLGVKGAVPEYFLAVQELSKSKSPGFDPFGGAGDSSAGIGSRAGAAGSSSKSVGYECVHNLQSLFRDTNGNGTKTTSGRTCYFIRLVPGELSAENIEVQVVFGTLPSASPVSFVRDSLKHVMLPLLRNKRNTLAWSRVVAKDVLNSTVAFLGSVDASIAGTSGSLALAMPPEADDTFFVKYRTSGTVKAPLGASGRHNVGLQGPATPAPSIQGKASTDGTPLTALDRALKVTSQGDAQAQHPASAAPILSSPPRGQGSTDDSRYASQRPPSAGAFGGGGGSPGSAMASSASARDMVRLDVPHLHKDRVHELEAQVVTWAAQIHALLACHPEQVIAQAATRCGADADSLIGVGLVGQHGFGAAGGSMARKSGGASGLGGGTSTTGGGGGGSSTSVTAAAVSDSFVHAVLTMAPTSFGRGISAEALVSQYPGPLLEMAFWQKRAAHLNSVWAQLLGRPARRVLAMLDAARSSHCSSFARVVRELVAARAVTHDTLRFTQQLLPWFVALEQAADIQEARKTFQPIMHLLLLTWKYSQFYNVPSRLVLLVRLVVNALIRHAIRYLSPGAMMKSLAHDGAQEAHDALSDTLRVCAALKSSFFDYKARSAQDCPENPWRMQNSSLWGRLDAFLERVHDLRDFATTVLQFNQLDRLVIGGDKGAALTASVREIRAGFKQSQATLCAVTYNVLDLTQSEFQDDFAVFRADVRQREKHLASVLTQAFDDSGTTHAQLKLLQAFSLVSRRGAVKDALESKYAIVLGEYSADLLAVQAAFIRGKDAPPVAANLPPTAGAVFWSRGLLLRVQAPMEMLRSLARDVLEREEARPVVRAFASLVTALGDFETQELAEWGSMVEEISIEELNKPLLRTVEVDPKTGTELVSEEAVDDDAAAGTGRMSENSSVLGGVGGASSGNVPLGVLGDTATVLKVNFSPDLVRLLREVKYLLVLGLSVPDAAGAVYRRAELFRKHTSSLEMMVSRINDMLLQMLPVERPIMAPHLKHLSSALTRGMRALTWKAHGVDLFIADATSVARGATDMMDSLTTTLSKIRGIARGWLATPLIVLPEKTTALARFESEWFSSLPALYANISEGGRSIIKLLREAVRTMHITSGAPEWQAYMDFVSQLVYSGLAATVLRALQQLADGLDSAQLQRSGRLPPLEITIDVVSAQPHLVEQLARGAGVDGAPATSLRRAGSMRAATASLPADTDAPAGSLRAAQSANEPTAPVSTAPIRRSTVEFEPPLGVKLAPTLSGPEVAAEALSLGDISEEEQGQLRGPLAAEYALVHGLLGSLQDMNEAEAEADMWNEDIVLADHEGPQRGGGGAESDADQPTTRTVRGRIMRWVDAILKIAGLFQRVDSVFPATSELRGGGNRDGVGARTTYSRDIVMSMEVQAAVSVIEVHVRAGEVRARALHRAITAFGPLVSDDAPAVFFTFLCQRAFLLVEDAVPSLPPAGTPSASAQGGAGGHFSIAGVGGGGTAHAGAGEEEAAFSVPQGDAGVSVPHLRGARVRFPASSDETVLDAVGNRLLPVLLASPTGAAASPAALLDALTAIKERGLRDFAFVLNLRAFGEELVRLRDLQSDVSNISNSYAAGFLRVNTGPLKQDLSVRIAKWSKMYSSYMEDFLLRRLQYTHAVCLACESSLDPAFVAREAALQPNMASVHYNAKTGRAIMAEHQDRMHDEDQVAHGELMRFNRLPALDDAAAAPSALPTLASGLAAVAALKHVSDAQGNVATVQSRVLTLFHPVLSGVQVGGFSAFEGGVAPVRAAVTTIEARSAALMFVVSRLRDLMKLAPGMQASLAFTDDLVSVLQWCGVLAGSGGGGSQAPKGGPSSGTGQAGGKAQADTFDPIMAFVPESRHPEHRSGSGSKGIDASSSGSAAVEEVIIAGRRLLQYIGTARLAWKSTINSAYHTREVLQRDVNSLSDLVRSKATAFDRSASSFAGSVASSAPFALTTAPHSKTAQSIIAGRDPAAAASLALGPAFGIVARLPVRALETFLAINHAYHSIDEFHSQLVALRREAMRLAVLEALVRFPSVGTTNEAQGSRRQGLGGGTMTQSTSSLASRQSSGNARQITAATADSGADSDGSDSAIEQQVRVGSHAGTSGGASHALGTLQKVERQLGQLKALWDCLAAVHSTFVSWRLIAWKEVNAEALADEVKRLQQTLRAFPPGARQWQAHQWAAKQCAEMATLMPLIQDLRGPAVRARHWAHLMRLTGAAVGQGDIAAADAISGGGGSVLGPGFKLGDVLAMRLHTAAEAVSEVVEAAQAEGKVERRLKQVEMTWDAAVLQFVPYPGSGGPTDETIYWLSSPDDTLEQLDEHLLVLQSTVASVSASAEDVDPTSELGRWSVDFKARLDRWLSMLSDVDTTLRLWIEVQRLWSSMEGIFMGSADVRSALPEDIKRFEGADAEFKELLKDAQGEGRIVVACVGQARIEHLNGLLHSFEACQAALSEYLELKKKAFPRFYFVSDASLLDILAHGTNPPHVVKHISDCFSGLSDLQLEVSYVTREAARRDAVAAKLSTGTTLDANAVMPDLATCMVASDGELLPFQDEYSVTGQVEEWLAGLEGAMRHAMRLALRQALEGAVLWGSDTPRELWVHDHLSQAGLLASLVVWTEETEAALEEVEGGIDDALEQYERKCTGRLQALVREVLSPRLDKKARKKLTTLITIDVHSRDVISKLVGDNVTSAGDFLWKAQLRFYQHMTTKAQAMMGGDPEVTLSGQTCAKISDFNTAVCHEFLGNSGRLVITPLTDRCYITLATALTLYLGGAPAGPAGTGKTETVKDLGKALGIPVYVFNCSDQMTYHTLADIFKGLSQTGAWGCFDEFNRIHVSVLSVVATQVSSVLTALRRLLSAKHGVAAAAPPGSDEAAAASAAQGAAGEEYVDEATRVWRTLGRLPTSVGDFMFEGDMSRLIPTTGIFITMNPGYAGRTELPENLKALFRSCAMIVPDMALICENMMFAYGFSAARELSVKFVTLYQLAKELLSPQPHYDWGLRAAKAVLMVAGRLKQAQVNSAREEDAGPGGDAGVLDLGSPLQKLQASGRGRATDSSSGEDALVLQALRDFNMPKVTPGDAPIYLRLVSDVFPNLDVPSEVDEALRGTAAAVCRAQGLQSAEPFLAKVEQLKQLMEVRHSVMLLGDAGTGKSTVWATLAAALNVQAGQAAISAARREASSGSAQQHADGFDGGASDSDGSFDQTFNQPLPHGVTMHGPLPSKRVCGFEVINPKAVTPEELYGQTTLTKEWQDGVLSVVFRNMAESVPPYGAQLKHKWLVLDGDIDAMWIESMNTVMDDNKTLTLVSNERIPLTAPMRLVFEMDSLKNATPATVSRAGIIHLHDGTVGWRALTDSWVTGRKATHEEKSMLLGLFDEYLERLMDLLALGGLKLVTPQSTLALVNTMCIILGGLLDDPANATGHVTMHEHPSGHSGLMSPHSALDESLADLVQDVQVAEENSPLARAGEVGGPTPVYTHTREMLEALFFFACVWSFGGSVSDELQTGGGTGAGGGGRARPGRGAGGSAGGRARFSKMFKALIKGSTVQFPPNERDGGTVFDFWYTRAAPGSGLDGKGVQGGDSTAGGRTTSISNLQSAPGAGTFTAGEGVSMCQWASLLPVPSAQISMALDSVNGLRSDDASPAGMVASQFGGAAQLAARIAEDGLSGITVPTAGGIRLTAMLHMLRCRNVPVMFVGTQGTGKSTLVREYLHQASAAKKAAPGAQRRASRGGVSARGGAGVGGADIATDAAAAWILGGSLAEQRITAHGRAGVGTSGVPTLDGTTWGEMGSAKASAVTWRSVPLSFYTNAATLQAQLEEHLDRRSGRVYGPSAAVSGGVSRGKTLVFFVDDLNMPAAEKYGTQTPIELLRALLDHGGWYDRSDRSLRKCIVDTAVVGAMNPTSGSFSISSRLQRHFATFVVPMPDDSDLRTVFVGILAARMASKGFASTVMGSVGPLVAATLELRATAALRFLPSSINFHYQWNLREVEAVLFGLCRANPVKVVRPLACDALGIAPPAASSYTAAYSTPGAVVALWAHECRRVFRDRLTTSKDVDKFENILLEILRRHFEVEAGEVFNMPPSRAAAAAAADPSGAGRSKSGASNVADDAGDTAGLQDEEAVFTNFTSHGSHDDPTYLPVSDMQTYTQLLQHFQREYNLALGGGTGGSASGLSLVLFRDAAMHVARIARVLTSPGGHLLLVGVGGSGKQSLTRLAAFVVGQSVTELSSAAAAAGGSDGGGYGLVEVQEVLKDLIRRTAVKPGEAETLLVTDSALLDESFMTALNDLMLTGDVPNLHSGEELDALFTGLRADAKMAGISVDDKNAMTALMVNKVQRNTHVVLAMSPVGHTLRTRARRFPALTGSTTIDWLHAWPETALVSVATQMLAAGSVDVARSVGEGALEVSSISCSVNGVPSMLSPLAQTMLSPAISQLKTSAEHDPALPAHLSDRKWIQNTLIPALAKHMAEVHKLAEYQNTVYAAVHRRFNYATPKSFLEFISAFQRIAYRKRQALSSSTGRLTHGLEVLARTQQDVDEMQEQLRLKMVNVEARRRVANDLLDEVTAETALAEEQKVIAAQEQGKADEAAAAASGAEAQATEELKRAEPALEQAKYAVNCLSKASMAELKSMQRPPDIVALVMRAVLTLLGERKSFTWDLATKAMGNVPQFKKRLETLDGRRIPREVIDRIDPILEHGEFDPPNIIKRSQAAGNLATWADNMVMYHKIFKEVEPLMHAKATAEAEKKRADAALAAAQRDLAKAEARVAALSDRLQAATEDKEAAEVEAQLVQDRLSLAQRLLSGLASEKVRWSEDVATAASRDARLAGECVLAAAFVSYSGGFDSDTRAHLLEKWSADLASRDVVPLPSRCDPVGTLSTDSQRAAWDKEGLPTDVTSLENAAIVSEALRGRWPLLVDPQLQGLRWLRGREADGLAAPSATELVARAVAATASLSSGAAASLAKKRAAAAGAAAAEQDVEKLPRRCLLLSMGGVEEGGVKGGSTDASAGMLRLGSAGGGAQEGGAAGESTLLQLQTAVKAGWSVLLVDVPVSMPPFLRPLVERAVFAKRGTAGGAHDQQIRLGGNTIKYHPDFRLYLQTREASPHFAPEVQAQCTLVNFTVTERGLEEQLLADVVKRERPEIEASMSKLRGEFAGYRIRLGDLEASILSRLSSASPDTVLGDVELIEGLENTKKTVAEIGTAVEEGKETEASLGMAREAYRRIAAEGTRLYFACVALGRVSAMYRCSLTAFKRFFAKALGRVPLALSGNAAVDRVLGGGKSDPDSEAHTSTADLQRSAAALPASPSAAGGDAAAASGDGTPQSKRGNSSGSPRQKTAAAEAAMPRTRAAALQLSVRQTLFRFVQRGLLSEHRLAFLSQVLLQLLRADEVHGPTGFSLAAGDFLLRGSAAADTDGRRGASRGDDSVYVPPEIDGWMTPSVWGALQAISELLPELSTLPADIMSNGGRFKEWMAHPAPEGERLPMEWKDLDFRAPFLKLCLVRAMRPDRLPNAIRAFARAQLPLGAELADCDAGLASAAVLASAFQDAGPSTPVYFILSAGADVDTDVIKLAGDHGVSVDDGGAAGGPTLTTVSLGQGQDSKAEAALMQAVLAGHWVLLNNAHLMPQWLQRLSKFMEKVDELASAAQGDADDDAAMGGFGAGTDDDSDDGREGSEAELGGGSTSLSSARVHPNFRVLLSSDPSKEIPENLLARCITLTSEPPSGLQVNLHRAFTSVGQRAFNDMDVRSRSIYFGLCLYHSLMLERRKFGAMGFNRSYPFGEQDLAATTTVLRQQMESASSVPWANLHYLVGEILYGGHITDAWDRRCSNTYLSHFLHDGLLGDMELFPYVPADAQAVGGPRDTLRMPSNNTWMAYLEAIEHNEALAADTPRAFGMHPNADVAYFSQVTAGLLTCLQDVLPPMASASEGVGAREGSAAGGAEAKMRSVESTVNDLLVEFSDMLLPVEEVRAALAADDEGLGGSSPRSPRAGEADGTAVSPFATVFLQECSSCNTLVSALLLSLQELSAGLRGELTIGDALEAMLDNLFLGRVPVQWSSVAYPSNNGLAAWLADLQQRHAQLSNWCDMPAALPSVTWLAGLFHPQSFLTAVLQTHAQAASMALDSIAINTDVTDFLTTESVTGPPPDGAYVSGIFLENARWDGSNSCLAEPAPKALFSALSVLQVTAVPAGKQEGGPGNVRAAIPVYRTQTRGPTYIFTAHLRTGQNDPEKWVLAGVAGVLEAVSLR